MSTYQLGSGRQHARCLDTHVPVYPFPRYAMSDRDTDAHYTLMRS